MSRIVTFAVFSLIIFFLGQAVLYWMDLLARPVETYPTYFIAEALEFSILGVILMVFLEPSFFMVIAGFVVGYYINESIIQRTLDIVKMKLQLDEHVKELLMEKSFFLAAMLIALDVLTFKAIFLIILITMALQLLYKAVNLKQLFKIDDLLADYLGNAVVKSRTATPLTIRMTLFVYFLFMIQFFISIVEAVVTFDLVINIANTIVQLVLVLVFLQRIEFFPHLAANVRNAANEKMAPHPMKPESTHQKFSITKEVVKTIGVLTPFLSFPVYYFASILVLGMPPARSYSIEYALDYLSLVGSHPFSIDNFFSIIMILMLSIFFLLFPFIFLSKDLEGRLESSEASLGSFESLKISNQLPRGFFTGILVVSGRYFAWELAGMFLVLLIIILVLSLIIAPPLDVIVTFKANQEMLLLMILGLLMIVTVVLLIQRKAHHNLVSLFFDYPNHVKNLTELLAKTRRLRALKSIGLFYRFSSAFAVSVLMLMIIVSLLARSSPLGTSLDVTLEPRDGGISHPFMLERGRYLLTVEVEVAIPNRNNNFLMRTSALMSLYFVETTVGNGKNHPVLAISPGVITKMKSVFGFELKSGVNKTVALILENLLEMSIHVKLDLIHEPYPDIWQGGPHYLSFVFLFAMWAVILIAEWTLQSRLLLKWCLMYYFKGSHEAVLEQLPRNVIYP